jgi:glycosyltransferase involved in cell wall biosynthesis
MVYMRATAIIIPCFNEERRLKVEEFACNVKRHVWLHFIFVNDGSTDGTMARIKALSSLYTRQIHYIDLGKNFGKAKAVWHGFQKAFDMGYENIGYWDADLSTPLSAVEQMREQLSRPEVVMVFGSRVRLLHLHIERKAVRHYLGRLFATVASLVIGLPVYDTQCGAKIFKNNINLQRVFSKPFSTSWAFDVEIFARFILLQKHDGITSLLETAVEHPLEEWRDVPGSKLNLWDFFKVAYELTKIGFFLYFPGRVRRSQRMIGKP